MTLPRFEYHAPETLEEACRLLEKGGKDAAVMAGGTDLLIKLRYRLRNASTVISLKGIPGLDQIRFDRKSGLTIGATALLSDVASHPEIMRHFPTVAHAALKTATVQIRNMGTVVGNLCNAAPSADNAPILLAMDAELLIADTKKERRLPLIAFFKGPGLTFLRPGEIVKAVFVPLPPAHTGTCYQSLSERGKVDIAAVGAAARVVLEGERCVDARIALGAVAPTPMRAFGAEKMLMERTWSLDQVEKAALRASREAKPITDMRATAAYRKKMVQVLTKRALLGAYQSAKA
jgi:aerobic carbon-monoxide dehydrogenase medium subunit